MSVSTYFRDLLLRHALLGQSFSVQWYVALHTGATATSANDSGIGRQPISWATTFANGMDVTFPMVVSPVTVRSVGLWDGPTGGNFLAGGALPAVLNLTGGQRPVVPLGGVQVEMPTV